MENSDKILQEPVMLVTKHAKIVLINSQITVLVAIHLISLIKTHV